MASQQTSPNLAAGAHSMTSPSLLEPDLFTFTPAPWTRARKGGPTTSAEATPTPAKVRASWQAVADALTRSGEPLTADEIAARVRADGGRFTDSRLSTAPSEMKRAGLMERADRNGVTSNGHAAYRWQLTKLGRSIVDRASMAGYLE